MEHILEWKCGWMGEWNGVQLMVLRRRRGDREIVEVWMDGRIECRVLRRSRGIGEIAEVSPRKCANAFKIGTDHLLLFPRLYHEKGVRPIR